MKLPFATFPVEDMRNPNIKDLFIGSSIIDNMTMGEEVYMKQLEARGLSMLDVWKEAQEAAFKRIFEICKEKKN